MDNHLQIFKHERFGNILTYKGEDGRVFFKAKDVARSLGYSNQAEAIRTPCVFLKQVDFFLSYPLIKLTQVIVISGLSLLVDL